MLASHIQALAACCGDRLALIHGGRQASYGDLADRIDALVACWRCLAGKRVGLAVQNPFAFVTAAGALDRLGAHAFLAGGRGEAELAELQTTFSWDAILHEENVNVARVSDAGLDVARVSDAGLDVARVSDAGLDVARVSADPPRRGGPLSDAGLDAGRVSADPPRRGGPLSDAGLEVARVSADPPRRGGPLSGLVTILTSGTTGIPKAANHTWTTLASPVRRDDRYRDTRWLAVYPLHLYAGTQVLLQALLNGAALAAPGSRDPAAAAQTLRNAGVTHASATPTFWRQILLFADRETLRGCSLEQITLGGETVTQDVLDGLAGVFPRARIIHIYASTESGRLFTVTDGKEGFPVRYLDSPPEPGIHLRVLDGQLLARSRNAMLGYENQPPPRDEDAWFRTGDLVEIRDDRVHFVGRASEVINVGGAKVSPAQIERVIREVPGVADVRVYGRPSALVGALVAADVQPLPDADPKQVQAAVQRWTRERLQSFQVPQVVRMVARLDVNNAGKVIRKG